jgi:hypothetical protein
MLGKSKLKLVLLKRYCKSLNKTNYEFIIKRYGYPD